MWSGFGVGFAGQGFPWRLMGLRKYSCQCHELRLYVNMRIATEPHEPLSRDVLKGSLGLGSPFSEA